MAVASGEALPPGEKFERLALRIGAAQAIGVVEAGDARRPELGRLGISQPVRDIIGVERDLEWREPVDDEPGGDEVDRSEERRVGKEVVSTWRSRVVAW